MKNNNAENNNSKTIKPSPLEQLITIHKLPKLNEITTAMPCSLKYLSLGCCE